MDAISFIKHWFNLAVPHPTNKNRAVQLGVHFEEFGEMLAPLSIPSGPRETVEFYATKLKKDMQIAMDDLTYEQKVELLDSLCDQIVTAVGVAHMFGMNIEGAVAEVNRSNWSKFVDGKPVFDANGKIAKGPRFTKPDLRPFVPNDITFVAPVSKVS